MSRPLLDVADLIRSARLRITKHQCEGGQTFQAIYPFPQDDPAEGVGSLTECKYRLLIRERWPN